MSQLQSWPDTHPVWEARASPDNTTQGHQPGSWAAWVLAGEESLWWRPPSAPKPEEGKNQVHIIGVVRETQGDRQSSQLEQSAFLVTRLLLMAHLWEAGAVATQ